MSLLQLPDLPDVPWARLLEGAGEGGSYAYQIDASGLDLRNRMMYRPLIPNSGSPAMKTRLRMMSTLQCNNPAFEGLAVRHRGYQLRGGVPSTQDVQVWDSDPSSKGVRAWYSQQSGTYTDAVFIEPVPSALGIDYVTVELIVRAQAGHVTISNAECRSHYGRPYHMAISGAQAWTSAGLTLHQMTWDGGRTTTARYIRYLKTESIECRRGQSILASVDGALGSTALDNNGAGALVLHTAGVSLRLRRGGVSTEDWLDVAAFQYDTEDVRRIQTTTQKRAEYDYDRAQLVVFQDLGSAGAIGEWQSDEIFYEDLQLDLDINDYIAPSQ